MIVRYPLAQLRGANSCVEAINILIPAGLTMTLNKVSYNKAYLDQVGNSTLSVGRTKAEVMRHMGNTPRVERNACLEDLSTNGIGVVEGMAILDVDSPDPNTGDDRKLSYCYEQLMKLDRWDWPNPQLAFITGSGGWHFGFLQSGPPYEDNVLLDVLGSGPTPGKSGFDWRGGTPKKENKGRIKHKQFITWPTGCFTSNRDRATDPQGHLSVRGMRGPTYRYVCFSLLSDEERQAVVDEVCQGRPVPKVLEAALRVGHDFVDLYEPPPSLLAALTPPAKKAKSNAKAEELPEASYSFGYIKSFLESVIAIYTDNPDLGPNYLTDESYWSGLMANIKYCGEEVRAEEEVKEYWLNTFCHASQKIYGTRYNDADNEKRYDAKPSIKEDGDRMNGVASLPVILKSLKWRVTQSKIDGHLNKVKGDGETLLVFNGAGRTNAYCVPFNRVFPMEETCHVLFGGQGISYSNHVDREKFNPFDPLARYVDVVFGGFDEKGKKINTKPLLLEIIRERMEVMEAIDLVHIGLTGEEYKGQHSLKPIRSFISAHNATANISDFNGAAIRQVRDDFKAMEFCKSWILAAGTNLDAVEFAIRVVATKVRWPSLLISVILSFMSTKTRDGELKGGTGKNYCMKYVGDSFLAGRFSEGYNPLGRFNGHEAGVLLACWDEHPDPGHQQGAVRAAYAQGLDVMKNACARLDRSVEKKGVDICKSRNDVMYYMCINSATGAWGDDAERRLLRLRSCSSMAMSPEDRKALGNRLEQHDYKEAVLEFLANCKPLSESEREFVPRFTGNTGDDAVTRKAKEKADPKRDALFAVIEDLRMRPVVGGICERIPNFEVGNTAYTMEHLAEKVNDELAKKSTTRAFMIINLSNSGLGPTMAKMETTDGRPVFILASQKVKRTPTMPYQPATYTIDCDAVDDIRFEGEDDSQGQSALPTPDELDELAISLWEKLRGQKWTHGRTYSHETAAAPVSVRLPRSTLSEEAVR